MRFTCFCIKAWTAIATADSHAGACDPDTKHDILVLNGLNIFALIDRFRRDLLFTRRIEARLIEVVAQAERAVSAIAQTLRSLLQKSACLP